MYSIQYLARAHVRKNSFDVKARIAHFAANCFLDIYITDLFNEAVVLLFFLNDFY